MGKIDDNTKVDTRYRVPKGLPKVSDELINSTINGTEIYSRAKLAILMAQREQVAYGIEKYPEPLNADTWSIIETIDHIIGESIDKLHYLVMLRIKLEREVAEDPNPLDISELLGKKFEEVHEGFEEEFKEIGVKL